MNSAVSLTGATGFVGWHLAEAFRDAGWRVRAVVRPASHRALPSGVERVEASLTSSPMLSHAFDGADLVLHCAGAIRARDEAAFDAVNVGGTQAVVLAANEVGARLQVISSLAAGGPGTPEAPRSEHDPDAPVNAYGRSKRSAEAVVKARSTTPWTILRPCAVYGPRDRGFLPLFLMAHRGWLVRPTPAEMSFTMIDVADLAQASLLAATSDRAVGQTFFIGHPVPQSTDAILRTLAELFGRRFSAFDLPRPLVRAAAAIGDLSWQFGLKFVFDSGRFAEFCAPGFVCSVQHVREQLAFTAGTSLEEGFARTAAWYREQGWV